MKTLLIWFCLFVSIITADKISADEDKSEIGVLLPLSGELSAVGNAVSNGIAVAIEKHPDRFDKIKFIYEDSRYDAKVTLSVFQTMIRREKMKLLYVWGSQTCMPVVPIAEKEGFPLVCFSGDPKPGLRYVMSFNSPLADYASRITEHVMSIGSSKIAIVYSEIPFYENLAVALEEQIKSVAFTYREGFLPSTQDFSTTAKKLKSKKFHALALFLLPHQLPTILKRMMELNYSPTIVGTDNFAELEVNKNTQGILDKARYVDMVIDPDFASAYIKKYGNKSNLSFAYNGYYFALTIANSFKGNKSILTTGELISKLRDYKDADSGIIFKESPSFGQYFSFPIELKKIISSDINAE